MKWIELSIHVTQELVEPVCRLFTRYGRGLTIEERHDCLRQITVRTYLHQTAELERTHIKTGVHLLSLLQPMGGIQERFFHEDDWLECWQENFTLLRIGQSVVVKPPWITYGARTGEIILEIEPGMAFGTGYHPTTRLCIELQETFVKKGDIILDLGTGSGILSIVASKLEARWVLALDTDSAAVREAGKNLVANASSGDIAVVEGSIPHNLASLRGFNVAIANLHKRLLIEKLQSLWDVLQPKGYLISSGILEGQENEIMAAFDKVGFVLVDRRSEGEWVGLVTQRV